jgi:hypothetical protein
MASDILFEDRNTITRLCFGGSAKKHTLKRSQNLTDLKHILN